MNIEKVFHYKVITTNEEDSILNNAIQVLESIFQEMDKRECTHLEWEDSGNQVSIADIGEMIQHLDTLQYVNIMF